jgi:hypothetical protein
MTSSTKIISNPYCARLVGSGDYIWFSDYLSNIYKYDIDGVEQWCYNTSYTTDIALDEESGSVFFVSDRVYDGTIGTIRKLTSSGIKSWTFDTCKDGECPDDGDGIQCGVAYDSSGNIVSVGQYGKGTDNRYGNVRKITANGTGVWAVLIGGVWYDDEDPDEIIGSTEMYVVAIDKYGNIYVGGETYDNKNLWKLDSDGNIVNSWLAPGVICDIKVDNETGHIYVGHYGNKNLTKLDFDLNKIWDIYFGEPVYEITIGPM